MTFLKKLVTVLTCSAAPSVLLGQAVELRSSDNFISVAGEITGFNGTLVTVMTSVGAISVPASEVVCYGATCAQVLADNDFGLTAAAFAGVEDQTASAAAPLHDTLSVSFAAPAYLSLYRTIAAAFAVSNQSTSTVSIDAASQVSLSNAAGTETAVLAVAPPDQAAAITVATTPLTGRMDQQYATPSDWAARTTPGHQMLALRAFAVVAGPDTGVDAISADQIAAIYAGEITNWSQIGGADLPVLPLQLPLTSEARADMIAVVMDPAGKEIASSVLTVADEAGIVASISGLPGSIGLVDTANRADARVLAVSGSCGFPVSPDPFTIAAGDYPLLRPVMARIDAPVSTAVVGELFDFAAAGIAQGLVGRDGFVAYSANVQDPVARNARLSALLTADLDPIERPVAARMFQVLFEAERLTPTLIGGATSSAEAAWNRAMMLNLSEWVLRPEHAGREVVFAGFGDSTAGVQDAIDTATTAAEQIAAVFAAAAPDIIAANNLTLSATGFGTVSPSSCYDGQVGGPAHTRVEVWIK